MTFAAVGSYIDLSGIGQGTFTLTPTAVGNLFLVEILVNDTTVTCTGLSGGNCTWQVLVPSTSVDTGADHRNCIVFAGTATATGSATVTPTYSGTPTGTTRAGAQEFSSTVGSWALDVSGTVSGAGGSLPSLTPHGNGELYFVYVHDSGAATAGTASGYTYAVDAAGNAAVFNPACTSATQAPNIGDSGNVHTGIAVLLAETPAAAQTPRPQLVPPGRSSPMALISDLPVSQPAASAAPTVVSDADTASAADAGGQIRLASADTASAADAGEAITATLASADTASALDAGEKVQVTSSDAGTGTESDGTVTATLASSDAGTGTESAGTVTATLASSDTAHGTDAAEKVQVSSADTGSALDAGEQVHVTSSDTGSALDAGEQVHVTSSDTGSAAESAGTVAATLASVDTGQAADAGEVLRASGTDTASAADASGVLAASLASADTSSASETAGPLTLAGADTGQAADTSGAPSAALSSSDTAHGTDAGEFVNTGSTHVSDTETAHAEDSGFTVLADSDTVSASDGSGPLLLLPGSSETGTGSETETSRWPSDSDAAGARESAYWSGPIKDSDTVTAAETVKPFQKADTDSVTAADALAGLEIFTYQPPFRWTGGGYELVWHAADGAGGFTGVTVWRGPVPDRGVYRLWARLAGASEVRHIADHDAARAEDDHDPAMVSVTVSARPAVAVRLDIASVIVGW